MTTQQTLKNDSRRFGFAPRPLARSALAGALLLVATPGCSSGEGGYEGDSPVTTSQPLTIAGAPEADVTWDGATSLGVVPGATGTPAVTSGCVASFVALTRVTPSGQYMGAADGDTGVSPWATYGSRSFASSPAITSLPNDCNGLRLMVVGRGAGSGANSRLYWSEGQVTRAPNFVFNAPVVVRDFAQVGSREFSGSNGYPAVTSSPQGEAFLAFRDGSNIYARTKAAGSNSWGPEQQAPALPAGWTPVGTPAIEYGFFWGPVTLVVRGINWLGQSRFFVLLYNQGSFRPSSWIQLGALPSGSEPVQGDPALEWSDQVFTHTLYYRSGESYYQTSFFLDAWAHPDLPAKEVIHSNIQPAYTSSPSVHGNVDIEQGRMHWMVGRAGEELFFSAITEGESDLAP